MERKIVVNGQEYDSVEAMPPDVRRLYEEATKLLADRDGDGVPDLMQDPAAITHATTITTTQFVVDGRTYTDPAAMPPEARARYEAAMKRLDADGSGVPDILESGGLAARFSTTSSPPTPTAIPSQPTRFESTERRLWLGVLVILVVLIVALAVWYGATLLPR